MRTTQTSVANGQPKDVNIPKAETRQAEPRLRFIGASLNWVGGQSGLAFSPFFETLRIVLECLFFQPSLKLLLLRSRQVVEVDVIVLALCQQICRRRRFCVRNEWVLRSLAAEVAMPKGLPPASRESSPRVT